MMPQQQNIPHGYHQQMVHPQYGPHMGPSQIYHPPGQVMHHAVPHQPPAIQTAGHAQHQDQQIPHPNVPHVHQQQVRDQQATHQMMHQKLVGMNEASWIMLGNLAETVGDLNKALACFEHALRHNPYSVVALTQCAYLNRQKERYPQAAEYFQRVLNVDGTNGEVWAALGNCYLMIDDLSKAYNSYQQALYYLSNPKDPKLWYGIGILYDRYGSYDHAEEAFTSVLKMDPKFEKSGEIYFRLGLIYKSQQKYDKCVQCFQQVLQNIPYPLTDKDVIFQMAHVYELQKDFQKAKATYENLLQLNQNHPKVLQQLGWIYGQQSSGYYDLDRAIQLLSKSVELDSNDGLSYYLLGRCFMQQQKYNKAYDCYQQAVYRDSRNPVFWCSIGVLYYQIFQYRDALDAYTRAIRINPYISEVWYNLGTLYESCNNQVQDAIDAYSRAAEMDQRNTLIRDRLNYLKQLQNSGGSSSQPGSSAIPPPAAVDIDPTSYKQSHPNVPTAFANKTLPPGQQVPDSLGKAPYSNDGTIPGIQNLSDGQSSSNKRSAESSIVGDQDKKVKTQNEHSQSAPNSATENHFSHQIDPKTSKTSPTQSGLPSPQHQPIKSNNSQPQIDDGSNQYNDGEIKNGKINGVVV